MKRVVFYGIGIKKPERNWLRKKENLINFTGRNNTLITEKRMKN